MKITKEIINRNPGDKPKLYINNSKNVNVKFDKKHNPCKGCHLEFCEKETMCCDICDYYDLQINHKNIQSKNKELSKNIKSYKKNLKIFMEAALDDLISCWDKEKAPFISNIIKQINAFIDNPNEAYISIKKKNKF